ncbi:C40 family peptidase [Sulfurirhabdus autotrophica]|uniref:Cell wall-associated NlpC family hydrolase n=1 Tax=Sulfurirhabdus autotrophica TaxID=1706046 RepID=A0A4R3YAF2_9PROT|nr:C40 family peptidase [Sulfurirhabdus autotrophica]TCV88977.1 cell wall-associated NlpC family hydrolase [Sulfurirhabdus autotrophica]
MSLEQPQFLNSQKPTVSHLMKLTALFLAGLLASCASAPPTNKSNLKGYQITLQDPAKSKEVVMYAMGLMGIDYQFGGSNPESGLDCSGMVSYIFNNALGMSLPHNAQQIAQLGREIPLAKMQPGDLVFFNTLNRSFSHVGIYIGDDRFIHAPSTNGKIRISSLKTSYYAQRVEAARSFFY